MITLLIAASLAAEAQHVIADHTVNPSAVQFKDIREGDGVICGEFNAPNKQGGYEGFKPFVYESKTMWGTGIVEGLVMNQGEVVQVRLGLYPGVDLKKTNAAMKAYGALLKRCPRVN